MDPISLSIMGCSVGSVLDSLLGSSVKNAIAGVIGNRADHLVCSATASSWSFFKNLRTEDPALNHDLERATREAYLLATLELIRQAELCIEVGTSGSRLMTAGAGDALAQVRRGLAADLRDLDDALPEPLTDVHLFLIDPDMAPAARLERLRDTLRQNLARDFARWLPGQDVPTVIGELLSNGWTISTAVHRNVSRDWYSLIAIAFIEKLKTAPRLSAVFESKLLAQIAAREPAAAPMSSFSGFTANLDRIVAPLQRVEDALDILRHDISDIKTDVRDIKDAVSVVSRVPRLMWVSSIVLVATAVTVFAGAALVGRFGAKSASATANTWMEDAAREAGLDLSQLTVAEFQVSVRSSVTMGDNNAMLDIRVPTQLDSIVARGALEYRVGSRPWKPSFIDPVSGELIAMLDTRDMGEGGPVQLRLDGQPGTMAGPFVGPFEYAIDVREELRGAERKLATTSTTWLKSVGATWSIDSQFIEGSADVVRAVRIGVGRDKLTLRKELPKRPGPGSSPQDLANYGVAINTMLLTDVLRFGIQDTLYGQVEMFDGTLGPVVEFKADGAANRPVPSGFSAPSAPPAVAPSVVPQTGAAGLTSPASSSAPASRRDIQGEWVFRKWPFPEPVMTLVFSGIPPELEIRGDGIEGKGQSNGITWSFTISASNGAVASGTLTFDSAGVLQMSLLTRQRDKLPSGGFVGTRK